MLPLRTRIFIIISLIVLSVLGISILAWVLGKRASAPVTEGNQPVGTVNLPAGTVLYNGAPVMVAPVQQGFTPKPLTTLETEQNGVKQMARIFTERYNSYSTDANFQNIREVKDIVTGKLWGQISVPLGGSPAVGSFVGITTDVIGTELVDWQDASAKVTLKTISVENKNNVETTRQRTAVVLLTKSAGLWLVDNFGWEK